MCCGGGGPRVAKFLHQTPHAIIFCVFVSRSSDRSRLQRCRTRCVALAEKNNLCERCKKRKGARKVWQVEQNGCYISILNLMHLKVSKDKIKFELLFFVTMQHGSYFIRLLIHLFILLLISNLNKIVVPHTTKKPLISSSEASKMFYNFSHQHLICKCLFIRTIKAYILLRLTFHCRKNVFLFFTHFICTVDTFLMTRARFQVR